MNKEIYVSKNIWGEYIWGYLHSISLIDNEFDNLTLVNEKSYKVLNIIKNIYLVLPCDLCSKHFLEWYKNLDMNKIYEPLELFYKTVELHNTVNLALKKPIISNKEALNLWGKILTN